MGNSKRRASENKIMAKLISTPLRRRSALEDSGGAIDCPLCGGTARMGLPRDATIESVTSIKEDSVDKNHGKIRTIECVNRHLVQVCFSYQRDIDPLIRELQTCRKISYLD